jgi:Ca2+/Na+ antiporter
MNSYVAEANENEEYIDKLRIKQKYHKKPPFSTLVIIMQLYVGTFFGIIISSLIPIGFSDVFYEILFVFGVSWGIHFSGTSFDHLTVCSLKEIFSVVLIAWIPCFVFTHDNAQYRTFKVYLVGVGCLVYIIRRKWNPEVLEDDGTCFIDKKSKKKKSKKSRSCFKAFIVYLGLLAAFVTSGGTALFFHGRMTIISNDQAIEVNFYEAIYNLYQSDTFAHFSEILRNLYYNEERDYSQKWQEFKSTMDIGGERRYLNVLGLSKGATTSEIKSSYRKMALKWHPDKYEGKNADDAQNFFYKIQEAYEKLIEMRNEKPKKHFSIFNDEL